MVEFDVLERLFFGLCIALHKQGAVPLSELIPMLELVEMHEQATGDAVVAEGMRHVIAKLRALPEDAPQTPLILDLMRHARTHPSLRAALSTWQAAAHPEELSDEIQRALRKLLDDASKPQGDGDSRDG
jgi:hypothetical protein